MRHPQLDAVIRRMDQVLLGSQVPFGRLDRRVAEQHLDLLEFPTGGAAHLRAAAPQVPKRDAGTNMRMEKTAGAVFSTVLTGRGNLGAS
jgi:hypothetical protein